MPAATLIIVDADEITRFGLEAMLRQRAADLAVVGTFASLGAAETYLRSHPVDVLLLDDSASGSGDVEHAISRMKAQYVTLKIIILSEHLLAPYIENLIRRGIAGFVYSDDRAGSKLVRAVETVLEGELYLSPRASVLSFTHKTSAGFERLTQRDLTVLQLMHRGLTVQESAAFLRLDDAAIYRCRRKLRQVLGVRTSEQIVEAALRRGLLTGV